MNNLSRWYRLGIIAASLTMTGTAVAQDAPAGAAPAATEPAPAAAPVQAVPEGYSGAEGTKVEIVVEKAIIALNENNPSEALQLVEDALKVKAGDPDLLRLKGVALNALKRPEEAQSALLDISTNHPEYRAHYTPLGESYLQQDRCDLAEPAFKKGLEFDATDGQAKYGQGVCAMNKGELQDAANLFEQSAALGANRSASEFFRGKALYDLGEQDKAKDAFQRLVGRDPDSVHGKEAKEYLAKMGVGESEMAKKEGESPFKIIPSATVSYLASTNVGLTPSGDILPAFLKKKADSGFNLGLGLDGEFKSGKELKLGFGVGNTETTYMTDTDYNTGTTSAQLYGNFETGPKDEEVGVTGSYSFGWNRLGRYMSFPLAYKDNNHNGTFEADEYGKWGIGYGNYSDSHTFGLSAYKKMKEITLILRGSASMDMYPNHEIAPGLNNNGRDSLNWSAGIGGTWATKSLLFGTDLGAMNRSARDAVFSYIGFSWSTEAQWLVTKALALRSSTTLSYQDYSSSTAGNCALMGGKAGTDPCTNLTPPPATIDSERKDFHFLWNPEIGYKVTKVTEIFLGYTLDIKNSSLRAYQYDRQVVTLGARARWE